MTLPKPVKRAPRPPRRIVRTPLVHRKPASTARGQRIARTSRPRKERRTTLAALRRKLWDLFARYVKDRDGNVCFTCDKGGLVGHGWHAGHMFKREIASVCYDPANVHSQCAYCNKWLRGNAAVYALRHMDKYGEAKTTALLLRSREHHQWKAHQVEELIAALQRGGADYESLYAEKYGL